MKKYSKKALSLVIILCLMNLFCFEGCGRNHENEIKIYYLNLDGTELVEGTYDASDYASLPRVDLYLKALSDTPEDSDLMQPIPSNVDILDYKLDHKYLSINFSENYGKNMNHIQEVLGRAAIVRSLVQLEEIDCVSFLVDGKDLLDSRGNKVGLMSADSFVENEDAFIGTNEKATITLYFSNDEGTALIPETQTVYYSSNESLEKLIVKKLIDGPNSNNLKSTIPAGTEIYNVSVMNGQCVVNLNTTFNSEQDPSVTEEVVLYSIVNSLTNLPKIDEVQITINGESQGQFCRYKYDLSMFYQFNSDVIYHESDETDTQKDDTSN